MSIVRLYFANILFQIFLHPSFFWTLSLSFVLVTYCCIKTCTHTPAPHPAKYRAKTLILSRMDSVGQEFSWGRSRISWSLLCSVWGLSWKLWRLNRNPYKVSISYMLTGDEVLDWAPSQHEPEEQMFQEGRGREEGRGAEGPTLLFILRRPSLRPQLTYLCSLPLAKEVTRLLPGAQGVRGGSVSP